MTRRRHSYQSHVNKKTEIKNKTRKNHRRIPTLSSQTYKILKNAWQRICKYKHKSAFLHKTVDLTPDEISEIQKTSMYNHIPKEIRDDFESTSRHGVKYETKLLRGRHVNIYIVFPQSDIKLAKTQIYLENIIAWLNFVSEIASQECAQTLNIYLLLTDKIKEFPTIDIEPIDRIHANTAFTTSCSAVNDIFVFRREEWFKVFMHETFHCFGLDFSSSIGDESNSRILSLFPAINPKTDIRLYETFCEMWAEVFHLMFCLYTTKNGKCVHFSENTFSRALHKEQQYSIYQSNKILDRAYYKYVDLFSLPANNQPLYTEKTQAFSYYVIKSIMMWNLDRFVKWCVIYSDTAKHGPPIQFNHDHISNYCHFIEELVANDGNYKEMVERIERSDNRNIQKNYAVLVANENTMRMTSIDPKWK